jgi:quercetin dioxygenase-like cupin family protein
MGRTFAFPDGEPVSATAVEWAPFTEVAGQPNEGSSIAIVRQEGATTFLLIRMDPGGKIAMHGAPQTAICYVASGSGTVLVPGQPDTEYAAGDTVVFGANVLHAWRNRGDPSIIAVTVCG